MKFSSFPFFAVVVAIQYHEEVEYLILCNTVFYLFTKGIKFSIFLYRQLLSAIPFWFWREKKITGSSVEQ